MAKKQNKFDFTSEEQKTKYLNEIIGFFHDERSEEIGLLAAEEILIFFIETVGEERYRKGILDSKKVLKEKFEDIELELDSL